MAVPLCRSRRRTCCLPRPIRFCGQRLLADRLLKLVVLQLLRWLLDHPHEAGIRPPGLITGLSDPRLATLGLHDAPAKPCLVWNAWPNAPACRARPSPTPFAKCWANPGRLPV